MTMSSQDVDRATGKVTPRGGAFAAGALQSTSAILTFFVGVFALGADDLTVTGPGYQYTFQTSGWGWANVLVAMVLAAAAIALFANATWARTVAIIVSCLAIVVTFLWMPYYPVGSAVLIGLDAVVIWAVATWNTSREPA